MPRWFPPPWEYGSGGNPGRNREAYLFLALSQSGLSVHERDRYAINSNPRRTCNTRRCCRAACIFSTPASANTPGNTARRPPVPALLPVSRFARSGAAEQPTLPVLPRGPSSAFRPLSRPSGYSTTPHPRESAAPPLARLPIAPAFVARRRRASSSNAVIPSGVTRLRGPRAGRNPSSGFSRSRFSGNSWRCCILFPLPEDRFECPFDSQIRALLATMHHPSFSFRARFPAIRETSLRNFLLRRFRF